MSNSYNLTQKIHELLPKINQKFGLKVEVIGNWQNHPQKGLFLATEKMEVMGKENWQKFLDECCLAIQADQIRQILVGLQEVLTKKTKFIKIDYQNAISASFEGDEINIKTSKYDIILESEAETLYKKWCYVFPTSLFDSEPEKVLTELVEILQNLLK